MEPTRQGYTFFWSGPFSQWHACRFNVDGLVYNCAEQFMMAQKASLFGDSEALGAIMASRTPREQKALGRKVRRFNQEKWEGRARDVVYQGNWAKFTRNPDLKELLLATRRTVLVEASPSDTIWGIGLAEDDPRALDPKTWRGRNWLGEVLTRVRDHILRREQA
jgi:ribA/ribD-fused uncharacterized protein